MSGQVADLDEPLRDLAEELGIDELRARLTDPGRQRKLNHVHDFVCPQCNTGITESDNLGELGHLDDCGRREKKYYGSRGGRSPKKDTEVKPQRSGQTVLGDYGKTVRADGGVEK